jgi:transcriptional regulator with XRE-family HTH domain
MEIFCKRIKELRIESGLTQKELAKKLNTTNSAVCDWEKGRTQPDLQMLKNIATLFDVSTDYLLGRSQDF